MIRLGRISRRIRIEHELIASRTLLARKPMAIVEDAKKQER
jgi:hypothetical protein